MTFLLVNKSKNIGNDDFKMEYRNFLRFASFSKALLSRIMSIKKYE